MERIDQFAVYTLARRLTALRALDGSSVSAGEAFAPLMQAGAALQLLLSGKPLHLELTRTAAEALREEMGRVFKRYFQRENGQTKYPEPNVEIPGWMMSGIHQKLDVFESVFNAEMERATTYYVPQRGLFSMPALVDRADDGFPSDLQPFIGEKCKRDFRAAGRCLAFNLPVAAGFHSARAVESMLHDYHCAHTGRRGAMKGWAEYLADLQGAMAATSPPPDERTLNLIKQMKDDWRNPTVHPRVDLGEADARIVFNMGEAAILAMAQEMKRISEAGGVQGALSLVAHPDSEGNSPMISRAGESGSGAA